MANLIRILTNILSFLPDSPFQNSELWDMSAVSDMLGFINWFIPFDICAAIMLIWLAAMSAWYIYKFFKSLVSSIINRG